MFQPKKKKSASLCNLIESGLDGEAKKESLSSELNLIKISMSINLMQLKC